MGWLDINFAMAPLGIITAMIGAIRVGEPAWLRAVIGRARENKAASEIELMSSTSHEVGELWNGEAIVRTLEDQRWSRSSSSRTVRETGWKHLGCILLRRRG